MLAKAGAIFMTAINVRFCWDALLAEGRSNRNVDFDIRLERTADRTDVLSRIAAVPGVSFAEAWGYTEASNANDSYEITRVYPDGGHGSMSLKGVPRKTRTARFSIMQGRWLDPGLPDGVVLNPNAYALMGKPTIGDMVRIRARGKVVEFQLIGVVREIGPAAAYMDEY
jgi:putative ABC transport system permease protein